MKNSLIGIILLYALTGITHAQYKLEINPSDSKYAKMSLNCENTLKCDEKLIKWIDNQKFFKGEWKETQEGSIVSKTEQDFEGNDVVKYFVPSNFTATVEDITQELADKAAAKEARRQEIAQVKNMIDNINNSNLPGWHKKLLKRIIKELKE
jgi:hypothetical protein